MFCFFVYLCYKIGFEFLTRWREFIRNNIGTYENLLKDHKMSLVLKDNIE